MPAAAPMPDIAPPRTGSAVPPPRVADHVVDHLTRAGVELALGIPGGTISPVYDALLDSEAIRLVTCRHEAAAVFAAAAYGRQRQRPAVVLVTSGPGVLNTASALASAHLDGLPMVLLVGEVPRASMGHRTLQDGSSWGLDLPGTLRALCKSVRTCPTASSVIPMLDAALQEATCGIPGPVVLALPADVLRAVSPPVQAHRGASVDVVLPDAADLAALIAEGEPVLLVGRACRVGRGPAAVRALAERLGAPVVCTPAAKGVFPESHPLSRGLYGVASHPSGTRLVDGTIDTLVVLGSALDDLSTCGGSDDLRPTRRAIHVGPVAGELGWTYPADVLVEAPIDRFVDAVLPHLPHRPSAATVTGVERLPLPRPDATAGLHPALAVRALQGLMPADTAWSVDSGEHFFFAAQYLELDAPDSFLAMLGLGSMGSGICGALGLQLADAARPVACICGDGWMLMHLGELATAAAENLPIRWFVFDDRRLGMVEHGHRALFGRTPDFGTGPVDLASAARALGLTTFQVSSLEELLELGDVLGDIPGPVLVDLLIDPSASLPKGGRLASLARSA